MENEDGKTQAGHPQWAEDGSELSRGSSASSATNGFMKFLTFGIPLAIVAMLAFSYFQDPDSANKKVNKATNPAWWLVWACGGSEEDINALVRQSKQQAREIGR